MSFRTTLLPQLLHVRPLGLPAAGARRAFHQPNGPTAFQQFQRARQPIAKAIPATKPRSLPIFSIGLGLSVLSLGAFSPRKTLQCDSAQIPAPPIAEPHSELNTYSLGFGAVAGICTGVFVKKGLKMIAFLLGGLFVLLQYMNSRKFISVDWKKVAGNYDSTFGTKTATGEVRAPTVSNAWNWFVDFVTANFQRESTPCDQELTSERATFIAGMVLGLRLG